MLQCLKDNRETKNEKRNLPPPYSLKAFTLSEVLITLVIIGVIAAITVPTLIQNHKRQEATDRLLKFYSTINQVILKANADGNNWEYWAEAKSEAGDTTPETATNFANNYLLPYLVYHKYETKDRYLYIYLNDGSYFYIFEGGCIDFIFDVNGDKKPNVDGRDQFRFLYCPESYGNICESKKFTPYKLKGHLTRRMALGNCKSNSIYCSSLLFLDDREFKADYPYHI